MRVSIVDGAAEHKDIAVLVDKLAMLAHFRVSARIDDFDEDFAASDLALTFEDVEHARYVLIAERASVVVRDHAGFADAGGANDDEPDFPGSVILFLLLLIRRLTFVVRISHNSKTRFK